MIITDKHEKFHKSNIKGKLPKLQIKIISLIIAHIIEILVGPFAISQPLASLKNWSQQN